MKHSIILILILFVLATGCSKKSNKITLKFSTWGSVSEISLVENVIKDFEKQNPYIDIELIHVPKNYFQKLHLLAASGLMPDVVFVNNLYGPLYAKNNIFLDLNFFLNKEKTISKNDFFPQTLDSLSYEKKLYAIPRDVSNLVIYYNKELFDKYKVPYPSSAWDFEEFLDKCKKLTKDLNNDGKIDVFGISFEEAPLFWLPYLWSNGGGIIDPGLKRIIINSPESLRSLEFYSNLRNIWHVAPTRSEAGSATMAQLFMQEKLAMHLSGRWFVPKYRKEIAFNWDVVRFPRGQKGSVVGCDVSGWAISANSKYPKEAWRFIIFLEGKNSIARFAQSGLIVPARKDAASSEDFLAKGKSPKNCEIFVDVIKDSMPTPVNPNYQEITDILNTALEPVWAGKTRLKSSINQEVLRKLEENL